MIYDWLREAWGELIGSGEFMKEALVLVWKQLRKSWNIQKNKNNFYDITWQNVKSHFDKKLAAQGYNKQKEKLCMLISQVLPVK